jgi:hypothetical protein
VNKNDTLDAVYSVNNACFFFARIMADIHEVLVHCSAAVFSGALSSCLLFRHEAMVLTTHNFFYVFKDLVRLPSRLSSSRRSTAVQWIGQET